MAFFLLFCYNEYILDKCACARDTRTERGVKDVTGKLRFVYLLAALLTAALLLTACALAEEDEEEQQYVENIWNYVDGSIDASQGIPQNALGVLERIRRTGKLRVATEPYFPPQEFIDLNLEGQTKYVGADMKMARLIAERMGVELEIVPMEFTEVLNAVAEDECDLAISGLSYTPGRAAFVEMSKGYHYSAAGTGAGILIREADAAEINSLDGLYGRKIIAQSGSLQEVLASQNIKNYREFQRLSSVLQVYDMLESGKADAAVVDIEAAKAYIQNNPDCGLALVPDLLFMLEEQFEGDRIAGKKGELQLMYFVNGVIDELLADGQYEKWFKHYQSYAAALELW